MKTNIKIMFSCFFFILYCVSCNSKTEKLKEIAVVNAKFEEIEKILNKYRIAHDKLNYPDLEKKETYDKYRTIFFPCGVENAIDTNVDILSRGTKIHSVSLKKDFLEINDEKIYKNIKYFIENRGNAYFSDYSYKLLDGAFKSMEFYSDFPNLGVSGEIILKLKNDLLFFCKDPEIKADMPYPGWIVVKSIKDSEILAESNFNTILNFKQGPIISLLKRDLGEAIYTSYHKTKGDDELIRFIIYRLSYKYLLDRVLDTASLWEQNVNCAIIDSVREWENYRSYIMPINEGNNTIYFIAENPFQIDIFDKDKKIILSKDSRDTEYYINLKSDSYQYCILKIYPANPKNLGVYSIVSASGIRIIPYYRIVLYCMIFIISAMILYRVIKTFGLKKFSGRIKQK